MRASVAFAALLVGSTAVAQELGDPDVPPLARDEAPPDDAPNYFDVRELGATTIEVLSACERTIARAYPDAADAVQTAYCGCFADAARSNLRAGRAVTPSEAQVSRCIETGRTRVSPYARQFAVSTASIAGAFEACMAGAVPETSSDRGFVCSCVTNAWIADHARPARLDDDVARCAAAGRYRERTGQNPTLRQFGAIRVDGAPDRAGAVTPSNRPAGARRRRR